METHWSKSHGQHPGSWRMCSTEVKSQCFFAKHSKHFVVVPALQGLAGDDRYSMYRTQIAPEIRKLQSIPPATSSSERTLLLVEMCWDENLADWLRSRQTVAMIRQLTKLPTSKHGIPWLGQNLREVIHKYMQTTKSMAYKAKIPPRMLLMNCPRLVIHTISDVSPAERWFVLGIPTIPSTGLQLPTM